LAVAITAAIVSWRNAAPLAYAAGSLGVLIGPDLLNLGKLQGLGAPVVSIGGEPERPFGVSCPGFDR
jgi:uncharacterized membrane protein